jgi:ribosomal-protein-alanine N-acetyltransferase
MATTLIKNAFEQESIKEVIAHTLAEENASAKILRNFEFTFDDEINDPEDGQIWKWVLPKPNTLSKNK